MLAPDLQPELKAVLTGILKKNGCPQLAMETMEEHVHILLRLARALSLASVVRNLKAGSSRWLRTRGEAMQGFAWQNGYGAFSVSESRSPVVVRYIKNQREHHAKTSFEDELVSLLKAHNVAFDLRYLWD